jgi:hypothetical protein
LDQLTESNTSGNFAFEDEEKLLLLHCHALHLLHIEAAIGVEKKMLRGRPYGRYSATFRRCISYLPNPMAYSLSDHTTSFASLDVINRQFAESIRL